jgi:hypothetical protein
MTAFFSYSAIGLGLLMIIFALLTCIISSQRLFLFLITVGLLIDIFVASFASYVSSSMLINAKLSSIDSGINLFFYEFLGLPLLLSYVGVRFSLFYNEKMKKDLSDKGTDVKRACYIIHFVFPGAIAVLLLLHCVFAVGWILIGILLFLWAVIKSPIQYLISDEYSAANIIGFSNTTVTSATNLNITNT